MNLINMKMIKDFLIINFTGKNDSIGLRIDNNFFIEKFQTNIKNNEIIESNILTLIKKNNGKIDENFSIIVNIGPGSFSSVRISLAIAKGIQITKSNTIVYAISKDIYEYYKCRLSY